VPQEDMVPIVVTPEKAAGFVRDMTDATWNKLMKSDSGFIRNNQQGDWLVEVAAGTWQAYAREMVTRMKKRSSPRRPRGSPVRTSPGTRTRPPRARRRSSRGRGRSAPRCAIPPASSARSSCPPSTAARRARRS
jgi:hypothetical protein